MLKIIAIPAFTDNYIWLLINTENNHVAVVDPGTAAPVLKALANHHLTLSAILLTHHHQDHVGGVIELLANFRVPVYAPLHDSILSADHRVTEGDVVELPSLDCRFRVIEIPGHTRGHIAYYSDKQFSLLDDSATKENNTRAIKDADNKHQTTHDGGNKFHPTSARALFCGDTLFTAGCGRLFEGTAEQMFQSLQKLAALPDETLVFCGHEYTAANLRFAKAVEPSNINITERMADTVALRANNLPTVPATLALEKKTNPFLRSHIGEVRETVQNFAKQPLNNVIEVFKYTRLWKDGFQ